MTVFAVFVVVAFWVFVICELCVMVAAMRSEGGWLEVMVNGTAGALCVGIGVGVFVVVIYAIGVSHSVLFGGA